MILATRNEHKVRELRALLPGIEIEPLPERVEMPPEDGSSFAEIALEKARAVRDQCGEVEVVADDSGIEASGLGGRPGIHSARYAGPGASDEENLEKLLREVAAAGEDRRVSYVCALAYVEGSGTEHLFEARCEGVLAERPRGSGGFGYDPAFVPDTGAGDGRTMSELSDAEKGEISHRGRAARMLAAHLATDGAARTGR